jgi:hypothetical protein
LILGLNSAKEYGFAEALDFSLMEKRENATLESNVFPTEKSET